MDKEIIQLHAIFCGQVQGIGFRWTIMDHASHFKLRGTVQNLRDGTVEIYAQGIKNSLESFLERVKNDAGFARIDSIASNYQKVNSLYEDFRIL